MNEITYQPSSKTGQIMINGGKKRIFAGQTIQRGDIPDDAFDYLATRPDFGGDPDAYKAAREARRLPVPAVAEPVEPDVDFLPEAISGEED